jgi:D-alanyl-lipoteichoic acid acyltransferase DltB (MBOAT superfamily)
MLFNTYTYAVFLPLVLALYLVLPLRGRQVLILLASYLFYCWEQPIYGVFLMASTVIDFVVGLILNRAQTPRARKAVLGLSIAGNMSLLVFFKYADFIGENIVGLGHLLGFQGHWKPMDLILPAGISFYTFQTLSYTIQMYRRQIAVERDFIAFAAFVSFFPHLVAGPIMRANALLPQLKVFQRVTADDVKAGLTRIVLGLFRKVVLADRFAILVNMVFSDPAYYSTLTVWTALPAFLLQIYFDFSGYSDIAIGSARLFGIHLAENFKRPLVSSSIADFWNRWHMTLTGWLRDYLFNPLGGFRKGGARALLNAWIVLLLCGLWHGARWNFVFWGAYQAMIMTLYYLWRFARKAYGEKGGAKQSRGIGLFVGILLTFACQSLSALLFRASSLSQIAGFLRAMFGLSRGAREATEWYTWLFLALIAAVLAVELLQDRLDLNGRARRLPVVVRAVGMAVVALVTLLTAVNVTSPYIYFQF